MSHAFARDSNTPATLHRVSYRQALLAISSRSAFSIMDMKKTSSRSNGGSLRKKKLQLQTGPLNFCGPRKWMLLCSSQFQIAARLCQGGGASVTWSLAACQDSASIYEPRSVAGTAAGSGLWASDTDDMYGVHMHPCHARVKIARMTSRD